MNKKHSVTGCRPDQLFGAWAIEPTRFGQMVERAKTIDLVALTESRQKLHGKQLKALAKAGHLADGSPDGPLPTLSPETPGKKRADDGSDEPMDDDDDDLYCVQDGIAVITLSGPLTKYETSFQSIFGGTSTLKARRAVRRATMDPSVIATVFHIDSPGGTVAGTGDLAMDVRAANAIKRCYGYITDLGASAAYWIASQCDSVYCNSSALVGCIGTVVVLQDRSEMYKQEGVTVHVVASDVPNGDSVKGAGTSGAPITDAQLADFKRQTNELNDLFVADVATGRKMTPENVRTLADGRVHVGEKAKALGLVDEIASFDSAMQAIFKRNNPMTPEQFRQFAAENPEAAEVKALIAQGFKAGKAEGQTEARKELGSMLAAFKGRETFAAEQFSAGHTAETAKANLSDVLMKELADTQAKLAESNKAKAEQADRDALAAKAVAEFDGPTGKMKPVEGATFAPASGKHPAVARFDSLVAEASKTMPRDKAILMVVNSDPALHAEYVAALQPAKK
jgi:signal peptide peptidase SppA